MEENKQMQHDFKNSLVVIKRLSKAIHPIVSKMSAYCIENKMENIASMRQLAIVKDSLLEISKEAEKLLEMYANQNIQFIKSERERS
jgi:hypothetical protein